METYKNLTTAELTSLITKGEFEKLNEPELTEIYLALTFQRAKIEEELVKRGRNGTL